MNSMNQSSPVLNHRDEHYQLKPNQMEKGVKRLGKGVLKKGAVVSVAGSAGVMAAKVIEVLGSWYYGSCLSLEYSPELSNDLVSDRVFYTASRDYKSCLESYHNIIFIGMIAAAVLGTFVYVQLNALSSYASKKRH